MSSLTIENEEPQGVKPEKAYKNPDFLNSRAARHIRIMCEYLETQDRLRKYNVHCTLMIFGSARCSPHHKWAADVKELEEKVGAASGAEKEKLETELNRLKSLEWLCEWWEKTYQLSKRLTQWCMSQEAKNSIVEIIQDIEDPVDERVFQREFDKTDTPLIVCTGGGPGLMEAANKGAYDVPGGRSAGMGISLPFEPSLNPYVTPELGFEYHYFFTRKFWMVYCTLALIATPGGIGTLDELFEVLTLKQTKKIKRDIPVILFGKTYWKQVINFDYMVDCGTISTRDRDSLFYTDSVDEAYDYIVKKLTEKDGMLLYPKPMEVVKRASWKERLEGESSPASKS
uniref:Cytokinin riboside 5'-monophosphate phosphoribohydrolase n=1 Tax=Chromera velia CCMP2878 TaxID=1169474 RepID=A0A0G4GBK1_9ALVE|mmetsp:Transcript_31414/g.62053  ORF Transcript_31414/g.62053 Transcript_31414/m.62053 type:complete len:342 (-) Transcript_31414:568-1593(-)|eukprot:Cvel_21107.t1-p1 / transcript=Cvel_21107.t1 / gene=Cvel_21107 / organism=Chromera_velia_CCMP2878 / gene_product=hypothetical protein / transcript_product=hypothetical protein / location=Cvel_scaffold1953:3101-7752(-) / protein_length=341 / sequence_SO=supercontig / SO=protein_coding / is_pseudo=false